MVLPCDEIRRKMHDHWCNAFDSYAVFFQMKCCGADGAEDYAKSDWVLNSKKQNITLIPISCIDESKASNGTAFYDKV